MTFFTYLPLLWLLILVPLLYYYRQSLVTRPLVSKRVSFGFRLGTILLIILALCQPFLNRQTDARHFVMLFDVSQSIDRESLEATITQQLAFVESLPASDSASMFLFADTLYPVTKQTIRSEVARLMDPLKPLPATRETALFSVCAAARLDFPADKIKILQLFSDGIDTTMDQQQTMAQLTEEGIGVFLNEVQSMQQPEASVVSLTSAASHIFRGETVRLEAKVHSNSAMNAKLRFLNKGLVLHEKSLQLKKDETLAVVHEFSVSAEADDVWTAELLPEKDHFPMNNVASTPVKLLGEAKVLVLTEKPGSLRDFTRALSAQGVYPDVRTHHGIPNTLAEFCQFNAVMFTDIPAEKVSQRQMELIKLYVTECGGGLIMSGSEQSFGLGGYYQTPIEDVLPVSSKYEKKKEHPTLSLVLVIDKSGSMGGAPIELAKQAAMASVELLSPRDQVAVIAFDGGYQVVCDMTSAMNRSTINNAIRTIGASGGTSLYPAMKKGAEMLAGSVTNLKHMIILSDGQSSGGDFEGCASEIASQGGTVSTVSLGNGAAIDLMRSIAKIGRGRSYVTTNAQEVPKIFTKDTMEASKTAIREEPYLPVVVRDHVMLEGLDMEQAPFLLGFIMTKLKPATEPLMITETGEPLLVAGRYGLGHSLAFTSDIADRWAGEWLNWPDFGKFWSQLIRSVINESSTAHQKINWSVQNDQLAIDLRCLQLDSTPFNGMSWQGKVIDANGKITEFTLNPAGHGRYTIEQTVPANQAFSVQLSDQLTGSVKTFHHTPSYPAEYRLNQQKKPEISRLHAFSDEIFNAQSIAVHQSALEPILLLALLSMMLSVLFRRV